MQCLADSLQPTINVCAKIQCPFFSQKFSSSKGCVRYPNSGHCHLTSVFAFKSKQQGLFTANESGLSSVKMANDGWIARDRDNQRQLRRCDKNKSSKPIRNRKYQELDVPIFHPYGDSSPPFNFPTTSDNFQPISISVLNSMHFEDY